MKTISTEISLESLSIEQIHLLHDAVMQDVQKLRWQWMDIAALVDPDLDDQILDIFKKLDKLEGEFLPEIEQQLYNHHHAAGKAA